MKKFPTITGMHLDIPNDVYHDDRTAASSTWLKLVDSKTLYHLRSYLDSPPAEKSPALLMGAAVDCLIFEPDKWDQQFIVAPELNLRTNDGKAAMAALKEQASKENKLIVRHEHHQEALATAQSVRTNPVMADILKRGVAQPVFIWDDPVTFMRCKCKLDWYDEETGTVYDLKTAVDASPDAFAKAVANFGYHIQQAFYMDGIRCLGYPAKRFVFCVQEKPDNRNTFEAHPNLMAFYELDSDDDEAGRDAYSSSIMAIQYALRNNDWPGYTNEVLQITRPGWARRKDAEDFTSL